MRKKTTVAILALGILVGGAPAAAQAKPGEIGKDYVSGEDVGPDKRDWFCTYQVSVNDIVCEWAPGNGSTSGEQLVKKAPTKWWNPWTW